LGALDQAGHIQARQIYLFTFTSSSVGSFDGPARQALFPALAPRAVLPNALLWKGAALIGLTLSGIAIAAMGAAGAFYADAASFLAVVTALLFMRSRAAVPVVERARSDFPGRRGNLRDHLAHDMRVPGIVRSRLHELEKEAMEHVIASKKPRTNATLAGTILKDYLREE